MNNEIDPWAVTPAVKIKVILIMAASSGISLGLLYLLWN